MIEILNNWDISIFTYFNSIHTPYMDNLMWVISSKNAWIPLYLALIIIMFLRNWKQAIVILGVSILCIILADQLSSSIIKPLAERLRPSHNSDLISTIHIVNGYRGSLYGFVSSHAANTFAFILLLSLIFKRWQFTFAGFTWAILVAYSRLYLGVHYLGDLIGGAIIGLFSGLICYIVYNYIIRWKWFDYNSITLPLPTKFTKYDVIAFCANTLVLVIISAFML